MVKPNSSDETYSLVCSKELLLEDIDENKYYLFISLMNQCYWVIGSAVGGLVGAAITFNTTGIEFAMTSLCHHGNAGDILP